MSCVYCTFPEIKARTVAENDLAWAFPTNIPITPGHMLVAPKRCVARADDLTAGERLAIEDLRAKITAALRKSFGAEGFNFAWNEGGDFAGQSVPHFHLHIVPRKPGDTGVHEYEPRKFLYRPGSREASPEAELVAVVEKIKEAME